MLISMRSLVISVSILREHRRLLPNNKRR